MHDKQVKIKLQTFTQTWIIKFEEIQNLWDQQCKLIIY